MDLSEPTLEAAHKHSSRHQPEISQSSLCGCFYCLETFRPEEIEDWVEDAPPTAMCPRCGIDSVIGDGSPCPAADADFLSAMHAYWFERTVTWEEGNKRIRQARLQRFLDRIGRWFGRRV